MIRGAEILLLPVLRIAENVLPKEMFAMNRDDVFRILGIERTKDERQIKDA